MKVDNIQFYKKQKLFSIKAGLDNIM